MSQLKHTPGPWSYRKQKLRSQFAAVIIEIKDAAGQTIVHWSGFDGLRQKKSEIIANARLIAASPRMLQALQCITNPAADDDDLDFARAVIAEATGGAA